MKSAVIATTNNYLVNTATRVVSELHNPVTQEVEVWIIQMTIILKITAIHLV